MNATVVLLACLMLVMASVSTSLPTFAGDINMPYESGPESTRNMNSCLEGCGGGTWCVIRCDLKRSAHTRLTIDFDK